MKMREGPAAPALLPQDEHNRRLAANVHPADWPNPVPAARYHLVVIGAGTAGLVTSAIAAALGARVALVEENLLGGDCLNIGCVPSKALLEAARVWHAARQAHVFFGGPEVGGAGSFTAVMERMRRIRADLSGQDSAVRFRGLGVDVFLGTARFTAVDALLVDEETTLRFRRAVIATGSRAAVPGIPGLEETGFLTNETIFSLTELPRRLAIIGGGPIGCELAQAFARFGSRVTLLEVSGQILPQDDPEAARVVAGALRRDGVHVACDATVTAITRAEDGQQVEYHTPIGHGPVTVDEILIAAGRVPNIEALDLAAAGVEYDARKGATVDNHMRTSNKRIFAIGDVASRFQFTHAADAQARLVVRNALFHGRSKVGDLIIPWCTYTQPELAHVGISAADAAAQRDEIDTITVPMKEVDRARLAGETEGFLRVHLKKGGDTILGASMVARDAGNVISQITQAMATGTSLGTLGDIVVPYPTIPEAIRKAADQHRRRRLTPLVKNLFASWFRLHS